GLPRHQPTLRHAHRLRGFALQLFRGCWQCRRRGLLECLSCPGGSHCRAKCRYLRHADNVGRRIQRIERILAGYSPQSVPQKYSLVFHANQNTARDYRGRVCAPGPNPNPGCATLGAMSFASDSFEAHPWLRNGHAMTIAAAFWPRRFSLPKAEARLFRVAEDSQLLAACHWQEGKGKNTPVIAIVHGLEGSC